MPFYVYRHEGGKKIRSKGPFDTKKEADEKCSSMNASISIPLGGFKVEEHDD